MLNIELAKAVRERIADDNNHFDMRFYALDKNSKATGLVKSLNDCGTACCLAGHTIAAAKNLGYEVDEDIQYCILTTAGELLGLSNMKAYYWFTGCHWSKQKSMKDVTREETIEFLDKQIAKAELQKAKA